jgi:hypothetical protein
MLVFSEDLLRVAILGTDNSPMPNTPAADCLNNKASAEVRFWQTVTFQALSQTAGCVSQTLTPTIMPAPAETLPTLPPAFQSWVARFLAEKKDTYFIFALHLAELQQKVFSGDLVLTLLDEARQRTKWRRQLEQRCGALGQWLSRLRQEWQVLYRPEPTWQDFENANNKERLEIFLYFRQQQKAEAQDFLDKDFFAMSAALRLNFLEVVQQTLEENDLPFLERCLSDKAQKVQALAIFLLSELRYPVFLQATAEFINQNLLIKKEKNQVIFEFTAPLPAHLRGWGIQEVSSQKGVSDALFWLYQLLPWLDPNALSKDLSKDFWQAALQQDFLLPALEKSALRFENKKLARALLEKDLGSLALLPLFSAEQQLAFLEKMPNTRLRDKLSLLYPKDFAALPESWLDFLFQQADKKVFFSSRAEVENFVVHLNQKQLARWHEYAKSKQAEKQEDKEWAMRQQWRFLAEEMAVVLSLYQSL